MRRMRRRHLFIACGIACLVFAGCGSTAAPPVETGTVGQSIAKEPSTVEEPSTPESPIEKEEKNLVAISVKFPDPEFQRYLRDTYGEVTLDCLQGTSIDLSGYKVKDFTGIEMYRNLEVMVCNNSGKKKKKKVTLKDLDISNCKKLRRVSLGGYDLSSDAYLDLDGESLREIDLENCEISEIPKSEKIRTIKLENTNLENVEFNDDGVTALTIKGGLKSFTISSAASLQEIEIVGTEIRTLDLSMCPRLQRIDCSENEIESISLPDPTFVTKIDCHGNKLVNLDLSLCKELRYIDCSDNLLKTINIDGCKSLTGIKCTDNNILGLFFTEVHSGSQLAANIKCDRGVMIMYNDTIVTAE